jgi:hypothetical protein
MNERDWQMLLSIPPEWDWMHDLEDWWCDLKPKEGSEECHS